ncbi:unnamed protein product [Rhodiola kirilowii]
MSPLLPATKLHSDSKQPLLQHKSYSEGGATVSGAVFNVTTSIIGAGVMSIPATVKVLGVIPALAIIITVATLADISVEFLMRFTYHSSDATTTYAGVMRESFGPVGALAVQISVLFLNLGCLIIYLIIIADVMSASQSSESDHLGVLQEWLGIHWWTSREFSLLVVLIVVLLPLVLLKRVDSLKFSSAVSFLLAVIFVGISSVMAISAVIDGKAKSPRLVPELQNGDAFSLFTAVPVIVTAFTFHFNVHPIRFELEKHTDMTKAVRISLIICAIIYFTIGISGYLLFGESLMADILVNFDRSSDSAMGALLNDVVRLSYALHLMLVFPLLNYSLRFNIDELLFPNKTLLVIDNCRFVSLTIALLALSYSASIAIPNIWYFFQFIGSTAAVCLAFIFPGAIVLRDKQGIATRKDRIVAVVMILLAVVTSTIAIYSNVHSLLVGNGSS